MSLPLLPVGKAARYITGRQNPQHCYYSSISLAVS